MSKKKTKKRQTKKSKTQKGIRIDVISKDHLSTMAPMEKIRLILDMVRGRGGRPAQDPEEGP